MARPEHKVTSELREQVATLAGGGMPHWQIAEVVGITRVTLEKHYEAELSIGAAVKRADVLDAMYRAALKGNVSAAKFYLAHEPQLAAPPVEGEVPEEGQIPQEGDGKPLGKKEQAQRDAQTAAKGTDWDELLSDRKVVSIR